jgi:hypothetical protein
MTIQLKGHGEREHMYDCQRTKMLHYRRTLEKGNALSLAYRTLLASRLQNHFVTINMHNFTIPYIDPSDSCRVLGVELNTTLNFTTH